MKRTLSCIISLVLVLVLFAACGSNATVPTTAKTASDQQWDMLILGYLLPKAAGYDIEIDINDSDWLGVYVKGMSLSGFTSYVAACADMGFTVDAEREEFYYKAYNSDGYELELYYDESGSVLEIDLVEPEELVEFGWPSTGLAAMLPQTPSNRGSIWWNDEESFYVTIGNMDKDAFSAYADKCKNAGYNIDYIKSEDYFEGSNAEGYFLYISYEGANTIEINLSAPEEDTKSSKATEPTEAVPKTTEPVATVPPETTVSQTGLRPEFKKAMDSYEEFMDEYIVFMKKYNANPTDLGLLGEYAIFVAKYAEFTKDFEKWDGEDLNNDEMVYYLDVQTRVTKKLLEIAQ